MVDDRRMPSWLWPVIGLIAVVALVVIGLNREPAEFDPNTPEGTVQVYIGALVEGDFETAASYWSDEGCAPISNIPTRGAPQVSVSLVSVDGNDVQANVVVRITENSEDPLGGLVEYQEWFTLTRQDGSWRVRQPSWPYYDLACEEQT
jgi:hypothetical protein